ncbi:unnamed protein product [Porites evermanni]|uniref:CRAL-TRIO domain-containing protein n=1 Tax=Porites evermanni TaxID=104178 RepID=A0ABN8LQS8_9CNID|nr:unnamed protein product [Porites evermanni]
MNNAEDFHRGSGMDPITRPAQDRGPVTNSSYVEEEASLTTGDESFLLEDDQAAEDFSENQRTSTPTKTFAHFEEDGPTDGDTLSPVLQCDAAENGTLTSDQSSSSPVGSSTQENSGEVSKSLYTSALSNVNATLTSDSYLGERDQHVVESTVSLERVGECSTGDSTWATAHGSLQEDSDLIDDTIKHEFSPGHYSSSKDDSNYCRNHGESTFENTTLANTEDVDSLLSKGSKSEDTKNFEEVSSPDLDLLNEICEEATNMTIKEALICSLNPEVRAGLREGRLSLNESEILALEQYCEQFIENLISQLLVGDWSERITEEENKPQPLEDKTKIMAQKLSDFGLETLKSNCDRFVHSVITESLHESCLRFQGKFNKISPERDTMLKSKQMETGLDEDSVEILLPLVKRSKAIQDYIGFLAADVIKSALANLSTSIATKNGERNDHTMLNEMKTSDDTTNTETTDFLAKHKERTQPETNSDTWKSQSDSLQNKAKRGSMSSITSDNEFEEQYAKEIEGTLDDEHMISASFNGALETSLEFDVGDWEGGGFFEAFNSLDAERKQKILLKELSFDEHAEVAGTELLAPVFLAIAEENDADTGIQGMRRKAQSIEDLCGIIDEPAFPKTFPTKMKLTKCPSKAKNETRKAKEEERREEKKHRGSQPVNSFVVRFSSLYCSLAMIKKLLEYKLQNAFFGKIPRGEWVNHLPVKSGILPVPLPFVILRFHCSLCLLFTGYFSNTKSTIVVLAACYLPDRSIKNYDFLMEQLFFYVISTLELLAIHDDYYLVYLNGGTRQQNMPSVAWMKRFYQYIEGGLKKKMKEMFIVHPSFRLKAVITLAKPFLNASFWRKLTFVHSLRILSSHIPVDYIYIPDEVMRVDPAYRQAHGR